MLITRMPLIDVIADAGTSVLNIFLVLRRREKHKNASLKVAGMIIKSEFLDTDEHKSKS